MDGRLLMRSRSGCLDDPLLEFIAQVVALELVREHEFEPAHPSANNRPEHLHDNRRDLRPLLDRQAGPLLDR
jgi:hypothetical protein